MVQFNLLPDVKIEYIKTKYRKRLIMLISGILSGICFAIFVILFLFVRVSQPHHISSLDEKVKTNLNKIQGTQDLDKILTIQNQLNTLPALHDKKIVASRLTDYLIAVVPPDVTISDMSIDFDGTTMVINGNAPDLPTVNKFTDTLKFTGYVINNEEGIKKADDAIKNNEQNPRAFKSVVLASFTLPKIPAPGELQTAGDDRSSFSVSLQFDPVIFQQVKGVAEGQQQVSLKVPNITSSRSVTEKPLFVEKPKSGN